MCQVVLASVRKHNLVVPEDSSLLYEIPEKKSGVERSRKLMHHDDLSLLPTNSLLLIMSEVSSPA
ncbi:hypothetical protein TSUD_82920 [Trifolium subterraneum]|uniref:Uncharacterized protein n=1 Tax=Trifolium subterraneum TaxID=3900 RepID=A0A2Z6M3L6_TRISU|nr:hypothetical protein TSUD_82920 [Trifolium subterraneum]